MKSLDELNESINTVIDNVGEVNKAIFIEVNEKEPLIVHQRFCYELGMVSKKDQGYDSGEFMDVLNAIRLLERLYPQLNEEA